MCSVAVLNRLEVRQQKGDENVFQKGEYVVHSGSGVCCIKGITTLAMNGVPKEQLYYALCPETDTQGTIYVPVDHPKTKLRRIMSKEAAIELIVETPVIESIEIQNEKFRETRYQEGIQSCDPREWMRIIKTIYQRKQIRSYQGKKITYTDERYMKKAEDYLYAEFASVFGISRKNVSLFIQEQINRLREDGI